MVVPDPPTAPPAIAPGTPAEPPAIPPGTLAESHDRTPGTPVEPPDLTQLRAAAVVLAPWAERFAAAADDDGVGRRLYVVGGVVRSLLAGHPLGDDDEVDMTTDAPPERIREILEPWVDTVWTQGERFGTVGCRLADRIVEITTHRADVYTPASRRPTVTYGDDLLADLERRDFTIGAMAFELPADAADAAGVELIDPFGGWADLQQRRLRTPGPPERSFGDDPLRMLRAARFVATLGLTAPPELTAAMAALRHRLEIVSVERCSRELSLLLTAPKPGPGIDLLARTGVLTQLIPELASATGPDRATTFPIEDAPKSGRGPAASSPPCPDSTDSTDSTGSPPASGSSGLTGSPPASGSSGLTGSPPSSGSSGSTDLPPSSGSTGSSPASGSSGSTGSSPSSGSSGSSGSSPASGSSGSSGSPSSGSSGSSGSSPSSGSLPASGSSGSMPGPPPWPLVELLDAVAPREPLRLAALLWTVPEVRATLRRLRYPAVTTRRTAAIRDAARALFHRAAPTQATPATVETQRGETPSTSPERTPPPAETTRGETPSTSTERTPPLAATARGEQTTGKSSTVETPRGETPAASTGEAPGESSTAETPAGESSSVCDAEVRRWAASTPPGCAADAAQLAEAVAAIAPQLGGAVDRRRSEVLVAAGDRPAAAAQDGPQHATPGETMTDSDDAGCAPQFADAPVEALRAFLERWRRLSHLEELEAPRPPLDGAEVMAHLGIAGGPAVGAALAHLEELRINEGPLSPDEARRRLTAWWEQARRAGPSSLPDHH